MHLILDTDLVYIKSRFSKRKYEEFQLTSFTNIGNKNYLISVYISLIGPWLGQKMSAKRVLTAAIDAFRLSRRRRYDPGFKLQKLKHLIYKKRF